ncbi:MAG: CAP domain-containing protein [Thermoactinomyces sp.]
MSFQAFAVGLMLFFSSLTGFDAVFDFFGIDKQEILEHIQQAKQIIVTQETATQSAQPLPADKPVPDKQQTEQKPATVPATQETGQQPATVPAQETVDQSELLPVEKEVFQMVNQEREKHGLQPLQLDMDVSKVAGKKSQDMKEKHYFNHQSPTYGSPFEMLQQHGIAFRAAGENIAAGQKTAKEVMDGWMNSEGHRANILNPDYTHIGIGYVEGGDYGTYWTQMFIQK